MLPLGHMGIGRRLIARWTRDVPVWAVLLGTLLPDLIDKPVYYIASAVTGRHGLELGLLSGTRTFGHTLLLTLIVLAVGWRRSPIIFAIGLGMVTHLGLDAIADVLNGRFDPNALVGPVPGTAATFWPLLGWQFPVAMTHTLGNYAHHSFTPVTLAGEAIGAVLLLLDWRKHRRGSLRIQRSL